MDNVKIYSRALTEQEVSDEYNKSNSEFNEFSIFDWVQRNNEWIHIGFVNDGKTIKTYVNGELANTNVL